MQEYKSPGLGRLALVATTLIWGSSFVILKSALDVMPTIWLLALRFTAAALLLAVIGMRELRKIDRKTLKYGAVLGVILFSAYMLQTFGLANTTPGKNAFLTSIYCVIVPFMWWLMYKKRPNRYHVIAAFVCFAGMGLVSLDGGFYIGLGDALTIGGGFIYALQIVITAKAVAECSVVLINVVQIAVCAALCWCVVPFAGPLPEVISDSVWWSLAYLSAVCTCVCFLMQAYGQKNTTPQSASIILTLEAVFGVIFSVIFYKEQLAFRVVCGFALIFAAVLISETKLSFLRRQPKTPCAVAEVENL